MRKMIKNKKGFTLIELILVVAIIAILAAVAVPKLSGFQDKAKNSRDDANIKLLNNLSQVYYADKGAYYDADNDGATSDTTITEFVNELEDEGYITTAEETNLLTATNWVAGLPDYEDTTGLVTP